MSVKKLNHLRIVFIFFLLLIGGPIFYQNHFENVYKLGNATLSGKNLPFVGFSFNRDSKLSDVGMSRLDPESSQSGSEDQSKLIGQLREQIATLSVQSAQTRPDHLSGSSQDNSKIKEVRTPLLYFTVFTLNLFSWNRHWQVFKKKKKNCPIRLRR